MNIKLTDAARYFAEEPHQIEALEYLQQNIPPDILEEFARKYRNKKEFLVSKSELEQLWESPVTEFEITELNDCLEIYDIVTVNRIRHFLAQISHECGAGKWMTELSSGRQYEGRLDLGNINNGDGPRYKGAGVIQLTGRYNYSKFAEFMKDPNIMKGHQYVAKYYPFTSGGFWWYMNKMNALVDSGASCRAVSARVNGRDPANGLRDRELYFARAKSIIK